jgi:ATP-dependent DNA helicase RecG
MSPPKEIPRELSGPLKAEERRGYDNRSVAGGLDQYVLNWIDRALSRVPPSDPAATGYRDFLNGLRTEFGQYLVLDPGGRRALLEQAKTGFGFWAIQWGSQPEPTLRSYGKPEKNVTPPSGTLSVLDLVPFDKRLAFKRLGINTLDDLLRYTPKWVVDRSRISAMGNIAPSEEPPFLLARINGVSVTQQGPRSTLKVILQDESGHLTWIWFNRPFLRKEMTQGRWVLIHDRPVGSRFGMQLVARNGAHEFLEPEDLETLKAGKPIVLYPTTPTLTQAFWRTLLGKALETPGGRFTDFRPEADGELSASEAVHTIHRPDSLENHEKARCRLAHDELFILQLFLRLKKRALERTRKGRDYIFEGDRILKFRKSIPFVLTAAQKRIIKEIRSDLAKPHPMNRLLQGDVGSGKTVVAAVGLLYAADSGVQGALMAPTEILAQQHYDTLTRMVGPVGLRIALLGGGQKAAERRKVLQGLLDGTVDVAVGTHALLEDPVRFKNLGLVVVDERHKFGVLQRAALEAKGRFPDALMMTATPFPRALVLTEYGDTDLSLLEEKPKGRKPITTVWRSQGKKEEAYQAVRERVLKGEQAFLVYPVVEESKTFLKSATQMYRLFQTKVFHGFRVGLLHGRMKKDEKSAVMDAFRKKDIQILVATTVVEVGVDVPDATLMVVENAERFGLAQLHQLRGRVGRSDAPSTCFLITSDRLTGDAVTRMKAMTSTGDGFLLSEMDLKLRGPGDLVGVAQSGRREGGLVDLKRDGELVETAREEADQVASVDPSLSDPKHAALRDVFMKRYHGELDLASVS